MVDLVIHGGKIVTDGKTTLASWVAVDGGAIVALGQGQNWPDAKQVIDVAGKYILPGVVDPEYHPCQPIEEAIPRETSAAVAGGVTTAGIMANSNRIMKRPRELSGPEDVPSFTEAYPDFIESMDRLSMLDYFVSGEMNNIKHFREIPELARTLGATSFKLYLHTMAGERMWDMWAVGKERGDFYWDDGGVFIAMRNVARLGPPAILAIHCENWEIARVLKEDLIAEGRVDAAAWDDHSPDWSEAGQLNNYAYYARITGCPLYLIHTTTRETLREVQRAKADGVKLIANIESHYLILNKDVAAINVPLRSLEDREACWEALKTGLIDCVSSDSIWQPVRPLEHVEKNGIKVVRDVWDSRRSWFNGSNGFMLPVMLSEGVNKGRISLERLVEVCCENTSRAFGLFPKKGTISIGSDADFVVVDLDKTKTVTRDMVFSRCGWSVWEGWSLKGWPVMTILRGNVVMTWPEGDAQRTVLGKPKGQYVPRRLGHALYPLS